MSSKGKSKDIAHSYSRHSSILDTPAGEVINTDNLKLNKIYVGFMTFFAVIGGFLFGYDTSVIAGAKLYFDDDFEGITNLQKEVIVSMTLLGAAFGSLLGGPVADKFGRKLTILLADVLFLVGCIVMAITPSIPILVVGRFIVGLGVGVAAMVVPIYLAEIAPKNIRGTLVNLNVVFIASGQFIALVVCLALGNRWRWMLGLAGIPAILQGVGILFMSESPRWLFKNGKNQEAIKAIQKIYNEPIENLEPIIEEQMAEVRTVREYDHYTYFQSIKQLFTTFRRCLIVGCGIQMFQQL
jgi:SP family myo-inositol transporter-like MFS transporter 13